MRTAVMACVLLCSGAALAAERYIVQLKDEAKGRAALAKENAKIVLELGPQRAVAAELLDAAVQPLRANPAIALVEPDPLRYPLAQSTPYGISMVQADQVWPSATGANRKVCIIDSGFALGHEDLQTTQVTGYPSGWDTDGCRHGTHVAGTVAALNNDRGVVGVAPNISLHIVKVFNDSCRWAYASTLIDAANRCEAAGANVISMSLGGPYESSVEAAAFSRLFESGLLSVAAAGNDGSSRYAYPASYDAVISVGAVDSNKQIASFSQKNAQVDLAAPGVGVLSTVPGGYASWNGTSMATPHVSAIAALVWSHDTRWTNVQIRDALQATAEDLGAAGRDNAYGHGLVRGKAALERLKSGPISEPTLPIDLRVSSSRKRGQWYANLTWTGATGSQVDVIRDDVPVARTVNDGSHADPLSQRGTYRYRICETSGGRCSSSVTITF